MFLGKKKIDVKRNNEVLEEIRFCNSFAMESGFCNRFTRIVIVLRKEKVR